MKSENPFPTEKTFSNENLTVFNNSHFKTDKTQETYPVKNNEFLRTIFRNTRSDERPILVSFSGDPTVVNSSSWFGHPWDDSQMLLREDNNNYFSLATFLPDEVGRYRRKKAQFVALHAIMLDDIGSKVPTERVTLSPTWLLETSPGNYQAGYVLSEPLSDGTVADSLMNAVVTAGLCDPGANGPQARLARLPSAVNGKHSPSFTCRLTSWEHELIYSVEALIEGLQLELKPAGRPKRNTSHTAQPKPVDGDPILIPRPEKNRVLTGLIERELYKSMLEPGKHDITCPWVNEHTASIDGGTAYFEPDDLWPIGGFKCLHGHCADRNIRDLLDYLTVDISAARMKSTIRVIAGELDGIVDTAERELMRAGGYYQRSGFIVTVNTDHHLQDSLIQEITQSSLLRALACVARWERYDARAKDWVRIDPPERHTRVLFDAKNYCHLPVLNGLARQPYLRPDGSLMVDEGYDSATGMYGVFTEQSFLIPKNPSRTDAENSLSILSDLLSEFSFGRDSDLSSALAAILTATIRPSLPAAPMFHAKAHMVGSGKSYLCELITAFATPKHSTPTTFPTDDEECRKLLLAELLHAPAVIEFDNLTSDLLAHKSLCTALTSDYITGRILGTSRTASVCTRTLFLSSGNNVGPIKDMTRRCVTIRLSPQCEVPATRSFSRPYLVQNVLRERGKHVTAALTIILAWINAGRPLNPCKPLASYGDWSDLCRLPLLWLGYADPATSVFEAVKEDPDRETLARLLDAWFSVFSTKPAMIRDAVARASQFTGEAIELREILNDIAGEHGEINRRKLGWWIRRHAGQIIENKRFGRASRKRSAEAWQVEHVESVSPVLLASDKALDKTVSGNTNAYARASRGE